MENLQTPASPRSGPKQDSESQDQNRWLQALSELTEMLLATKAQFKQAPVRPSPKKLKDIENVIERLLEMQYLKQLDRECWVRHWLDPDVVRHYPGKRKYLPLRRLARWIDTMLDQDQTRKDLIKEELAKLYPTKKN